MKPKKLNPKGASRKPLPDGERKLMRSYRLSQESIKLLEGIENKENFLDALIKYYFKNLTKKGE